MARLNGAKAGIAGGEVEFLIKSRTLRKMAFAIVPQSATVPQKGAVGINVGPRIIGGLTSAFEIRDGQDNVQRAGEGGNVLHGAVSLGGRCKPGRCQRAGGLKIFG